MGEVERQGLARSHIQILAGLTRLRQAACDPRLLGLPREFTRRRLGQARRAARAHPDVASKAGTASSSSASSSRCSRSSAARWTRTASPTSTSTARRRTAPSAVENFQRDDGPPVFLISLKAGGSGLNLTAADTVIHFDPWWNPAVEDQATDRAHRIGQTKVVTTYRLIAKGTIEEKILELGGKKRELVGAVLSEDAGRREEAHEDRPRRPLPRRRLSRFVAGPLHRRVEIGSQIP